MNISDHQKDHLKLVAEAMKTVNLDEYERYHSILKKDGFDEACKYVYGSEGGKIGGFSHNKNNNISYFAVNQTYPSRIECPGHIWSIVSKRVDRNQM